MKVLLLPSRMQTGENFHDFRKFFSKRMDLLNDGWYENISCHTDSPLKRYLQAGKKKFSCIQKTCVSDQWRIGNIPVTVLKPRVKQTDKHRGFSMRIAIMSDCLVFFGRVHCQVFLSRIQPTACFCGFIRVFPSWPVPQRRPLSSGAPAASAQPRYGYGGRTRRPC